MSEFALARESCEELLDYPVIIRRAENGAEERRLKGNVALLGFKIKTPALTKTQMQVYRSFIVSKYGALTQFTFTSPMDDVEYNVRFVPNTFKTTFESGYFVCSFEFERC